MIENILDDYYSSIADDGSEVNRYIGLFSLNSILTDKQSRLAHLYYSAFASDYSVFGTGNDLSCISVICALLLIYRFMTIDQFHALLPQFAKYRLSNFSNWSTQNNKPLITSTDLDKKRVYYHLTKTGYDYYRSFFPEEFLKAARIPANPGKLPSDSRVLHDIMLRDVPYGCLSINTFSEFDWYTSIRLLEGKSPAESVTVAMTNDNHSKEKAPDDSKIIADGIMLWRYQNYCSVIIEQDKGTEGDSIIANKLCSYGNYLNTIENPESIYILFNIYLGRNNIIKNSKNSLSSTFDNIALLMAHDKTDSLETFYNMIINNLKSASGKHNSFAFMLRLLHGFIEDGHTLSEGLDSLRAYVSRKREDKALIHKDTSPQSKAHYTNLKKLASNIVNGTKSTANKNSKNQDTNDYSNLIAAINKGASILFTENVLSYAYYLFPYDSGFLQNLKNNIERAYNKRNICQIQRQFKTSRGIVLKNCIIVESDKLSCQSFYCVHEISCDITSYHRLNKFFRTYTGNNVELHFLILVSSTKDATLFCTETDCINKFCCKDDILSPNPDYNLTIRFIDYSPYTGPCSSPKLFLPTINGTIVTDTL